MPILQSRLKLLVDAAEKREDQLQTLLRDLRDIYNEAKRQNHPRETILNALGIQIELTKALLEPNAIIAKEKEHYHLTHNRNINRKVRLRQIRARYREEHPNTKTRDQHEPQPLPGLANPSPEIPAKIPVTMEEKREWIMNNYGAYVRGTYKDDWERHLPGGDLYDESQWEDDWGQQ